MTDKTWWAPTGAFLSWSKSPSPSMWSVPVAQAPPQEESRVMKRGAPVPVPVSVPVAVVPWLRVPLFPLPLPLPLPFPFPFPIPIPIPLPSTAGTPLVLSLLLVVLCSTRYHAPGWGTRKACVEHSLLALPLPLPSLPLLSRARTLRMSGISPLCLSTRPSLANVVAPAGEVQALLHCCR